MKTYNFLGKENVRIVSFFAKKKNIIAKPNNVSEAPNVAKYALTLFSAKAKYIIPATPVPINEPNIAHNEIITAQTEA